MNLSSVDERRSALKLETALMSLQQTSDSENEIRD